MTRIFLVLGLLLWVSPLYAADLATETALAKKAVGDLVTTLQKEMKAAMKKGGPKAAIGLCQLQALPLTAQISEKHGFEIKRTSLRLRNQNNNPDNYERGVLLDFEARQKKGQDPKNMVAIEVVEMKGKKIFRFMKAIPTGKVCLTCHGEQLQPEITRTLDQLYPSDKARGYKEGEIRGAFSLQKTL